MTKTIQPNSRITIKNAEKHFTINKQQEENIVSLFRATLDNLNNLYEKLNRLDYLIKRKKIEQFLYRKNEGEKK